MWEVTELWVDDQCMTPGIDGPADVPVSDEPSVHSYRAVVVSPDGTVLEFTGAVTTKAGRDNGEGCEPRTANATIVVGKAGDVTFEYPSDRRWFEPSRASQEFFRRTSVASCRFSPGVASC